MLRFAQHDIHEFDRKYEVECNTRLAFAFHAFGRSGSVKCIIIYARAQSMKKEMHPSTPRQVLDCIVAISSVRHAGMDCRRPGSQDTSGDVPVDLGSSPPCWNDEIERFASRGRDPSATECLSWASPFIPALPKGL
jgi:hypothetical protein